MKKFIGLILAMLILMMFTGCNDEGKVKQGRTVAFDKEKGQVTFIEDKSLVKGKPEYTILPPSVFLIPTDKSEMGADPTPGQRMKLDADKNTVTIFDTTTRQFKEIPYTLIEKKEKVGKDDPLVKGKEFPIVDRTAKTIEIFSSRQKIYVSFSLPVEYFALPDETWAAGDEIRIYYKEEGKSLRLMNITKTDIFKK
ncbi:MAG: DUF4881 domain-containing protein [Desulfobacula sp. RIFOXYA12_FULL_46_16]|nr:MAG: DUF4881 domain-containing protein [Desulfobacula sp. RIFOXYA12_FULL_46_16]